MQLHRPVQTRFRYAFAYRLKLAAQTNSLTHYAKGTRSHRPKAALPLLVGTRFQVSFTPLVGVLFTFPSRYWFAIGRVGVLRLGGWSPHVQTGFHVPRPTRGPDMRCTRTGLSPAVAGLSRPFRFRLSGHWPGPRSLATTNGVSVDVLSSGYLDVSVRRVRLARLWIHRTIPLEAVGFPIRKSPDQRLLAAPRGLSQRATSFIASTRQGIHHVPLLA